MRGVIIAGGSASRFGGGPKGLELVGGRRMLDRVADALAEALGVPPLIVANAIDASDWRPDLMVVPDDRPGLGALGGIYTAITRGPAPVVAVAWDMPFVSAPLVQALAHGLGDADACLPSSNGPRGLEPLCAAYGPACRAAIERAVTEGDLRAIGFHRFLKVGILPIESVPGIVDPSLACFNVNTANDLAEAEAAWLARGSSRSSGGRMPERPR